MPRRLLALAATVAIVWWVVGVATPGAEGAHATALALGFALIAAALSGALLERFGLPRVTGYLLFGMVCGPYIANIITRPMARELQLINGLAVVLIAFIAGNNDKTKINFVFGEATTSVIWLMLLSLLAGLIGGVLLSQLHRRRQTRMSAASVETPEAISDGDA